MVPDALPPPAVRTLPHNTDAEQALLGAALWNNDVVGRVNGLAPSDFFEPVHGALWGWLKAEAQAGRVADAVTAKRRFDADPAFAEIGGAHYLVGIARAASTVVNAVEYAHLVQDLAERRRLILIAEDLRDQALDPACERTAREMIARARSEVDQLDARGSQCPTVTPLAWAEREPPARRWLVPDWIPWGYVTLLYGDGGTNKSLAALQLQLACATGGDWLGFPAVHCRTLGVYCEDDADELERRFVAARRVVPWLTPEALRTVAIQCRAGHDNVMWQADRRTGKAELTPVYYDVLAAARRHKAELVILDTAADIFGGNENDRSMVRAFLSSCCLRLAREIGGSVLLLAHPSVAGLASGDGTGGSTAWSNSGRARLYLKHGDPGDQDARVLSRKKSNFSQRGEEVKLRWQDGALVRDDPSLANGRPPAATVFLQLLRELTAQGRPCNDRRRGAIWAPRLMAGMTERAGYQLDDFADAMEELLHGGRIKLIEFKDEHREMRQRLVIVGE